MLNQAMCAVLLVPVGRVDADTYADSTGRRVGDDGGA